MHKTAHFVPTWLKIPLYHTLFYSKLCYGAVVRGTSAHNYTSIIKVQKKIGIYMNYNGPMINLRTEPLFQKYSMLRANQVYSLKLLQIVYDDKLALATDPAPATQYSFRRITTHAPKARTNYSRQTLWFQSNSIINKTTGILNFSFPPCVFNKQIKKFILENNLLYFVEYYCT